MPHIFPKICLKCRLPLVLFCGVESGQGPAWHRKGSKDQTYGGNMEVGLEATGRSSPRIPFFGGYFGAENTHPFRVNIVPLQVKPLKFTIT